MVIGLLFLILLAILSPKYLKFFLFIGFKWFIALLTLLIVSIGIFIIYDTITTKPEKHVVTYHVL